MSIRTFLTIVLLTHTSTGYPVSALASASDANLCLAAAERIDDGEDLSPAEKQEAHDACRRAIEATSSIVQKYQFDEADFAITGQRYDY
ncbi:MAG: hypothetical protein QNJ62_13310 [Methyloceanibacter sp.]|nr:hypothetical protein [Methyloceanibacter sp.]